MTVVQFVKAIVEESSLKVFDVLWANARERRMCDVDRSGTGRTAAECSGTGMGKCLTTYYRI